ncbi:DUF6804 family protein [Leifsonia sp. AG29]|uniref:DUF6804 family protein n=1 Tax=Leifsonia sp. AG29 TaxID=2598860 RepID=UPI00131CD8D2|nr:DUF6804 family protein [Leifsonia sp. AG29]
MSTPRARTPQQPAFNRAALVPGLLGAIALLAGLALVGGEWYLYIRYAACVLALILCVFAGQARQWWWLAGLLPLAVLWNPVWPIPLADLALRGLSIAGAVVFTVAAITIKIPADPRR